MAATAALLVLLPACATSPSPDAAALDPTLGRSAPALPADDAKPARPVAPAAVAPSLSLAPAPLDVADAESADGATPDVETGLQGEIDDVRLGREGTWEVTLGGVGGNDEDFEAGGGQLAGSVGYFVTDTIQVVGRQNVAYADAGKGFSDVWNGSTRVAVDFHFPIGDGEFVPFAGANFGWVYGDTVKETLAAAPEVGLKWYVQKDAFVQAMAEYQFFFDSSDQIDEGFEDGSFVYGLGIGLSF